MKIGIDVDGVLAAFIPRYQQLFVELTGRDDFQPGDNENPWNWDWPENLRGYTTDEAHAVRSHIRADRSFWENLEPLEGARHLQEAALSLLEHDVYFITDRYGRTAKNQTENWLLQHTGFLTPTVLITANKGLAHRTLGLDAYIDDKASNIEDCYKWGLPESRLHLLSRNYNLYYKLPTPDVVRTKSVRDFLNDLGI